VPPVRASLAIFAAATLLVSCASTARPQPHIQKARTATTSTVSVSVSSCGTGWTATTAGRQRIAVHNVDSRAGEAQLIRPKTGAVFVDVEPLGPGTTTSVDLTLAAGRYAWRCLMEDEPAVLGRTRTLTGHTTGATPGARPVTEADLIPPTQAYERYVSGRLPHLATLVARLRTDLAQSDLTKARHDWLAGHLQYERLGAAYDAFGDLDGAINGLPDGLPKGIHDKGWTGFHRIEYGLWHGQSARQLLPLATTLATDVKRLRHQFATAEIDPLQIGIRAHEISENALEFELTGRTNFGSNSQLDTVTANLHGTQKVLAIVHKLIAPRYAKLPAATTKLRVALRDIAHHASHERIDADISQLCELLAPVADILEPRKTS
jgi:iron uptake system component EfeO